MEHFVGLGESRELDHGNAPFEIDPVDDSVHTGSNSNLTVGVEGRVAWEDLVGSAPVLAENTAAEHLDFENDFDRFFNTELPEIELAETELAETASQQVNNLPR